METGAQSAAASLSSPLNASASDHEPSHHNAISTNGHAEHAAEEVFRQELTSVPVAVNTDSAKHPEETKVRQPEPALEAAEVCHNRY
jgi:hypothetical protein